MESARGRCGGGGGGFEGNNGMRSAAISLAIIGATVCGHTALADVVASPGQPPSVGVRILSLKDGLLTFRLPGGREVTRPIDQIEYLQIADWPLFNLAEKQMRDGQDRQATLSFEKAAEQLVAAGTHAPEPPTLDRLALLRCRLVRAYDRQGRFDEAVAVYLALLEGPEGAGFLESARPVRMPAAGSTFLAAAAARVEAVIERHGDGPVARSLRAWRETWPALQPASAPASVLAVPAVEPVAEAQVLQTAERDILAGRFDLALADLDRLLEALPRSRHAEALYWRGRALAERGLRPGHDGRSSDNPQADLRRAALAFMRVVIQYPGHARVPECLYRAGEACRAAGSPEEARALWLELTRDHPAAGEWPRRGTESLTGLPASAAAPG